MRLLALEMGADIVYTEETVDKKILLCERVVNGKLTHLAVIFHLLSMKVDVAHTVDFVDKKERNAVLRTCAADHPNVFQIGTSDPILALKAAELV